MASSNQPNPVKTVNASDLDNPPVLDEAEADLASHVETSSEFVDVRLGNKTFQVYTQRAIPKNEKIRLDILFLHGMSFTSQNWVDIKTLYHVALWGHRAIAVDLPGFGKSKSSMEAKQDEHFLPVLISSLGLKRPVIVSPSMSGSFSLPYLFNKDGEYMERAMGFVPIAPVATTQFVPRFTNCQLPTLIVCGTNDQRIGPVSTKDLSHLPQALYAPIEGAGHACYMNDPEAFHKLLFYFLNQLHS